MGPLSSSQVLALAREAMRVAHENEAKAAQASGVGDNLKPGLTVDLSRKRIEVLPEEIVDIIKDELERYAHALPPSPLPCLAGSVLIWDSNPPIASPCRTTSCRPSPRDLSSVPRCAISMSGKTTSESSLSQ